MIIKTMIVKIQKMAITITMELITMKTEFNQMRRCTKEIKAKKQNKQH